MTADDPSPPPRRRALLIGNAAYADARLARLAVPATDVRALAALLADPTRCGFDTVTPLLDRSGIQVPAARHRFD